MGVAAKVVHSLKFRFAPFLRYFLKCYYIQLPAQRGSLCVLMWRDGVEHLVRKYLSLRKLVCPKETAFGKTWVFSLGSLMDGGPIACCTLYPKGRL